MPWNFCLDCFSSKVFPYQENGWFFGTDASYKRSPALHGYQSSKDRNSYWWQAPLSVHISVFWPPILRLDIVFLNIAGITTHIDHNFRVLLFERVSIFLVLLFFVFLALCFVRVLVNFHLNSLMLLYCSNNNPYGVYLTNRYCGKTKSL